MSDVKNEQIWLMQGDCLERMKEIPDGSVDMILCDLPYGTTSCKWDSVLNLEAVWENYWRVLKPNGVAVLTAQTPFDKVLGFSQLQYLRYEWIWEKGNATGHLNANRMPLKAHENVLVFYKGLPTYNPQKTQGHDRKSATKRKDITQIYGRQEFSEVNYDSTERFPRSVQYFSSDKQKSKLHPTQKPVALMEYLIRTYTNEGETVLDNCMGSGTTGVACANINRKFLGVEQDKDYFDIAKNRIEAAMKVKEEI